MNNIIIWICRVFLGLVAAILVLQGGMWGFFPESNLATNSIEVSNALGINMIKSDIGGGLVAAGLFILLFLFKGRMWFLPSVIIAGSYLIIRTVSLVVDGSHPTILIGIALESLVLIALIGLNKLQKND